MKRTTVVLPDELASLLEHERRREGVSTAALIRRALESYLSREHQPKTLKFVGIGRSGQDSGVDNVETILDREWADDILVSSGLRHRVASRGEPGEQATPDTDSAHRDQTQRRHAGGR